MAVHPPLCLRNSPRLNDLANRSNEYLTSNRFLLTTRRVPAIISHEIGTPAKPAPKSLPSRCLRLPQRSSRHSHRSSTFQPESVQRLSFQPLAASLRLFALFFRAPPCVFNNFQPLFAKCRGGGTSANPPLRISNIQTLCLQSS